MAHKIVTRILPADWASGLINGDWSGSYKIDKALADRFLSDNNLPAPVSCSEDQYFSNVNDANNVGGMVAEYHFIVT